MKYVWTGTEGEASPLCMAGKQPVNQDGPLGVPESRPTPASPEEGHPQKAPISSSSSFCYRHWALMKQTKNKQNAPDWDASAGIWTKPQSVIVPMTGLEQCQQQSPQNPVLRPLVHSKLWELWGRNVALLASGTHRGTPGSFDLVLNLQTCFCSHPWYAIWLYSTTDIKAQVCLLL